MELIKELEKQANANSTEEYRNLKAVKAGKYMLSVQGSSGHYCSPRMTLPVDIYAEMELAIINKKGALVSINKSKIFRDFKRYDELFSRIDCPNTGCAVYGYVSVGLLNELYCFLRQRGE